VSVRRSEGRSRLISMERKWYLFVCEYDVQVRFIMCWFVDNRVELMSIRSRMELDWGLTLSLVHLLTSNVVLLTIYATCTIWWFSSFLSTCRDNLYCCTFSFNSSNTAELSTKLSRLSSDLLMCAVTFVEVEAPLVILFSPAIPISTALIPSSNDTFGTNFPPSAASWIASMRYFHS